MGKAASSRISPSLGGVRGRVLHLLLLFGFLPGGCDQAPKIEPAKPKALISDSAHGGTPGFYFLPPLVPQPTLMGGFVSNVSPVVQIAWIEASISTFATPPPPPTSPAARCTDRREPGCSVQRPAAEALVRAHRALKARGYGLLIYDGYRPWSVTKVFWDVTPPEKHKFVANPARGSRHNRGCAVDVGLYRLRTSKEVPMPSPFDEMSERAAADFSGGTPAERRTRALLRQALEKEGFTVNPDEWWHFDYKDWKQYRVLDVPFEQVGGT
jgi:zinc D-Ala-D-Ala dipeptidase